MSLTLEEIRNTKFHIARRQGYEVVDVDLFVDRVEAAFGELTEENEALKKEIEALKSSAPAEAAPVDSDDATERQWPSQQGPADQSPKSDPDPEPAQQESSAPVVAQAVDPQGNGPIVVTTAEDASPWVTRIVQMATQQAEQLVNEASSEAAQTRESARAEADGVVGQAKREAYEITTDARTKAERIESEARVNAERMRDEASTAAAALNAQTGERRAELLATLESERDTLRGQVKELREFEQKYRSTFSAALSEHLKQVESGNYAPTEEPALLTQSEGTSSTPRLDALMRDEG